MKGNGLRIFFVVFFVVLSVWYLYPTVRSYFLNQKLESLSAEAREQYEQQNYNKIQNVNEKALKLGLDLQGGMHVGLEVRTDALIRELATDTDTVFAQVLTTAHDQAIRGDQSVIDAFVQEFERRDPNVRLSRYFRNEAEGITRRSSNADVRNYLQREADEAVGRAIEIIRQRIDRFGVSEPSIQKQGSRRIIVELPGVDEPERVRRLLRGTARLEFHLMPDPAALQRSLQLIIQAFQPDSSQTSATAQADTAAADADSSFDVSSLVPGDEQEGAANPLLAVMQPVGQGELFGTVAVQDTAAFHSLLSQPRIQALLPPNTTLMYTANAAQTENGQEILTLLGVRKEIELTGDVITDARVQFNETNQAEVSMTMNSEGARDWARITGANVNRPIAIVLDNRVYSYPRVINRIPNGRSSITGLDSREEAQDVVTILKSGALPAPVDIVEQTVVGPSLGAAAIHAGILCMVIGLLAVGIFMVVYYRTGGILADIALLVNVLFVLGVLAAFHATLTLPGIAGMVLTFAAAVDANVLIYERMREEMATGKTLRAAIDTGYSKAFSSIFDSQITGFFVGAILYVFGVGPIQGFAVTLMIGIVASMFSAIVITRLIFDYMVNERRMHVSVG
ncbi:MAG TPA: protein translocase subunit SecD [Rhodothermales bacterium]|nr:protein translocase subunit SecD [Rhodothermales bacterium]